MAKEKESEGRMSQNEMVLLWLRTVGPITPMDALGEFGIMRLASRISDIRRKQMLRDDERLIVETVKYTNRFGKETKYARYKIVQEEEKAS